MKKLIYFKYFYLSGIVMVLMVVLAATMPFAVYAQAKPDLTVSSISTPGGLCAGEPGKVRVTVTNGSMAGVIKPIPVKLVVSQSPFPNVFFEGFLSNGIGPNDNSGQPVWFNDVLVPSPGTATLKAQVNPDQQVEESNYNNNSRIQTITVKDCNKKQPKGANLTVTVYKPGPWQPRKYEAITAAKVEVECGPLFKSSGETGSDGKVLIESVPQGPCTIRVSRKNCLFPNVMSYIMPSYNANVNMDLDCQW